MDEAKPLVALREYRERQTPPLSQSELGRKLGVTRQTVWRWEAGERSPDRKLIPQISSVTGVPVLDLMGMAE